MYVIGTAGHVDHGKSALVQALTGIDPDRLQEEKERGMTIDLGFAWLTLPSGQQVSIVDVPGHERFIKNMLAGVGGIDLALLVIAADEGVMPQTTEHLAILDLLQVKSGILVITKADLVEDEWLALVAEDAREAVKGTTLANSPLVVCSAVTREGLDHLAATIEARLAETTPRRDIGRPRLPVDRVFTISGFGTIVTGTLIDGSLTVGQEVEVVPGSGAFGQAALHSRVRGLQTHRAKVERAQPGSRVAVNLAGLSTSELRRGMVVTTPGWLTPTVALDVRLRAVRGLSHPLRHNTHVTFHTGSAEVPGRVRLLDQDELPAGEEAWAQIRLQQPVAAIKGDYFVLRTPNETVGGGQIVEIQARRHRRFHAPTLEGLAALERGGPENALLALLARYEPVEVGHLVPRLDLTLEELLQTTHRLIADGQVVALDRGPVSRSAILFTSAGFAALTERARHILVDYHQYFPLRRGMSKEELRSRLGLQPRVFAEVVEHWRETATLQERSGLLALPGFEPRPSPAEEATMTAFLQRLESSPYAPPTDRLPSPEVLTYLEESGRIVRVGEVVFTKEAYDAMVRQIVQHLQTYGTITLAQVRDLFRTSRKYAQALLEDLDERRVTRRVGDERVLRSTPAVSRSGEAS